MKKLTQEEANRRDILSNSIRIGNFTTVQTKTEYICKICNKPWLVKPESVWKGERGHHKCVRGFVDYTLHIGKIVNNCLLEKIQRVYSPNNKRKESYIHIVNTCKICGTKKTSMSYNMLFMGVGCCTKQKYDTLNIESLYTVLYKNHKDSLKKDNRTTNISKSDYKYLIMQPCEYPGCRNIPFIHERGDGFTTVKVNGIDRLDSSKNYDIHNNIGILCFGHNSMKTNFSQNELVELEPKWADYFNKKRDYKLS